MEETKSFYKSKTLLGAGISLLGFLLTQLGVPLAEGELEAIVIGAVELVGLLLVVYGRIAAKSSLIIK